MKEDATWMPSYHSTRNPIRSVRGRGGLLRRDCDARFRDGGGVSVVMASAFVIVLVLNPF
jgi:hypothetical protein